MVGLKLGYYIPKGIITWSFFFGKAGKMLTHILGNGTKGYVGLAPTKTSADVLYWPIGEDALCTHAAFFQDALGPDWSALPPTVLIKTTGDRKGHYRTTGEERSLALLSLDDVRESRADSEFPLRVDPLARRRSSTDLCQAHISGGSAASFTSLHSLYLIAEAAGQTRWHSDFALPSFQIRGPYRRAI